jgi:hypothetical protein
MRRTSSTLTINPSIPTGVLLDLAGVPVWCEHPQTAITAVQIIAADLPAKALRINDSRFVNQLAGLRFGQVEPDGFIVLSRFLRTGVCARSNGIGATGTGGFTRNFYAIVNILSVPRPVTEHLIGAVGSCRPLWPLAGDLGQLCLDLAGARVGHS